MAFTYDNGFESGDFTDTHVYGTETGTATIVTTPTRGGTYSLRITQDNTNVSGVSREQIAAGDTAAEYAINDTTQEYWEGFSFYADPSWPNTGPTCIWRQDALQNEPEITLFAQMPENVLRFIGINGQIGSDVAFPKGEWIDVVVGCSPGEGWRHSGWRVN